MSYAEHQRQQQQQQQQQHHHQHHRHPVEPLLPEEEERRQHLVAPPGIVDDCGDPCASTAAAADSLLLLDHQQQDPNSPLSSSIFLGGEEDKSDTGQQHQDNLSVVIADSFIADSMDQQQQQQQQQPQHDPNSMGPFSPQEDWSQQPMEPDPSFSAGQERAHMWQQSNYMADPRASESGFISASNTNPPSASGHDEMDSEGNYIGRGGSITGSSIFDLDALPHSEMSSVASSQSVSTFDPDQSLPELLKTIKDDDPIVVDQCLKNIATFFRAQKFKDALAAHETRDELAKCVSAELHKATAFILSPENQQQTEEMERMFFRAGSASKTLYDMTIMLSSMKYKSHVAMRSAIVHSDAVKAFTFLLSSTTDRLINYACSTLHTFLNDGDEEKFRDRGVKDLKDLVKIRQDATRVVRENGGVPSFAKILIRAYNEQNIPMILIAVDSLRHLAFQHDSSKKALMTEGIAQLLMDLLGASPTDKKLHYRVLRLLKVLSTCNENKQEMIRGGILGVLAPYLSHPKAVIVLECVWTVRNLSDTTSLLAKDDTRIQEQVLNLIPVLVGLLNHSHREVFDAVVGILRNFTCNNNPSKIKACEHNGIERLSNILQLWGTITVGYTAIKAGYLLGDVIDALKNIIWGHQQAERAQEVFLLYKSPSDRYSNITQQLNLLHCLTRKEPHGRQPRDCPVHEAAESHLHTDSPDKIIAPGGGFMKSNGPHVTPHWESVRKILLLFKTLSEKSPRNRHHLRAEGFVEALVQFLYHIASFMNAGGSNGSGNNNPEFAAKTCMDVLYNMAKDSEDTATVMHTLAKFMSHPSESLKLHAVAIVNELTSDPTCANFVKSSEECIKVIRDLSNSRNEKIAYNATRVIDNLDNAQPLPQREFLYQQQQQQHQMKPAPSPSGPSFSQQPIQRRPPPPPPQRHPSTFQQQQQHPLPPMQGRFQGSMPINQGFQGNRPNMVLYQESSPASGPLPSMQQGHPPPSGPPFGGPLGHPNQQQQQQGFPPPVDQGGPDFFEVMGEGGHFPPQGGGGGGPAGDYGAHGGNYFDEEMS